MKIACTIKLSDHQREIVEQAGPRVELFFPKTKLETGSPYFPTVVDPLVKDCEVLLGHINPKGLAQSAPNLKWIHLLSAGVDHVLRSDLLDQLPIVLEARIVGHSQGDVLPDHRRTTG